MKVEKARIYTIDKWGRVADLKERVIYIIGIEHVGRKVFIGKHPDRCGRNVYIALNLNGSYLTGVYRLRMTDLDVRIIEGDRERKKLIEDIETLKRVQTEYERNLACLSEV